MAWLEVKLHDEYFRDDLTELVVIGPGVIDFLWASAGTGTRIYRCTSDVPVSADAALTASAKGVSVDQPGDAFSDSRPSAYLASRESRHVNGSPRHLEVTLTFKDPTGGAALDDLLGQPAVISSMSSNDTQEYTIDNDTPPKPLVNAAGVPFGKVPSRLVSGAIYKFEKYVNETTKVSIDAAVGTNNQNTVIFFGYAFAENSLLLRSAGFEAVPNVGGGIYKATYYIEWDSNGFDDPTANAGLQYRDPDTGNLTTISEWDEKTHTWEPISAPVGLLADGSGQIAAGDPVNFIHFYPYPLSTWAGVPLS